MYHGERFNGLSHLCGAVAALIGLLALVDLAIVEENYRKLLIFSVYGSTLVILYVNSTLYHSLRGRAKRVFRKLDHYSIYLLIAGTYTPFSLITLQADGGWTLFVVIWSLAFLGIGLDSLPIKGPRILPIILYLGMGWSIILMLEPLLEGLPLQGFYWLLGGGVFYTVGVIFYVFDTRVMHFHGFWHLCVLAGSGSHYAAIYLYVN